MWLCYGYCVAQNIRIQEDHRRPQNWDSDQSITRGATGGRGGLQGELLGPSEPPQNLTSLVKWPEWNMMRIYESGQQFWFTTTWLCLLLLFFLIFLSPSLHCSHPLPGPCFLTPSLHSTMSLGLCILSLPTWQELGLVLCYGSDHLLSIPLLTIPSLHQWRKKCSNYHMAMFSIPLCAGLCFLLLLLRPTGSISRYSNRFIGWATQK